MGARTMGQDEDSCVVYGMPKEAAKLGTVDEEPPLSRLWLMVAEDSSIIIKTVIKLQLIGVL